MIRNSINGKALSQVEFRTKLESKLPGWNRMTGPGGGGVSLVQFIQYISSELKSNNSVYTVEKIKPYLTSEVEFKNILQVVSDSSDKYIIFHYNHHYSPFGELTKSGLVKILDVDYSEVYDTEFFYDVGKGERNFDIKSFYSLLKKTKKSIILIKKKI